MNPTIRVLEMVDAERQSQDKKWGANRILPHGRWMTILMEEVGEAAEQLNVLHDTMIPPDNAGLVLGCLRDELVQVAAVAVAWIEQLNQVLDHGSAESAESEGPGGSG